MSLLRRGDHPGLGAMLGLAMAVANVLSYGVVLVLSRALGPADFGGFAALSAYGIILAVPAGALQVIVARHVAAGSQQVPGVLTACWVGGCLAAVTVVAAPLLTDVFRLANAWPVVWLALTLPPMTFTGAVLGILLGSSRLAALSGLYLATAGGRVAAAMLAAALGLEVAEVFALFCAVAVAVALVGAWSCRADLARRAREAGLTSELVTATVSLAAFIALTNVDVVLARAFLTDHESGGYALASTFGRAIGWGTQFIALLVVPQMQGPQAARALRRGYALVLVLGLTAVAAVALAPQWWVRTVGGDQYAQFAGLAVACSALGVLWALVQLSLFAEMGRNRPWLGRLTWAGVLLQSGLIAAWWHESPLQIVAVCAVTAGGLVLAGLIGTWRPGGTSRVSPESAGWLATGP